MIFQSQRYIRQTVPDRIDDRVQHFIRGLKVGNIYINRNQIGAVVGSQPFGGEGISGTGPKAGGPNYLPRLQEHPLPCLAQETGPEIDQDTLQLAIDALEISAHADTSSAADLPGPTSESNRLLSHLRGAILCLGPTIDAAAQAGTAFDAGCAAVMVTPGAPSRRDEFHVGPERLVAIDGVASPQSLAELHGLGAVALWEEAETQRRYRMILSARDGLIISLLAESNNSYGYRVERHICIDTAAGGDASLLASVDENNA